MHNFLSNRLREPRLSCVHTRLLACLCATFFAAPVMACSNVWAGANTDLVIDTWDDETPDMLVSDWTMSGNAQFLLGCATSDVFPITATPSMAVLRFVRNVVVDGVSFPAFEISGRPQSPLLVFRYVTAGAGGIGGRNAPLDIRSAHVDSGVGLPGVARWAVTQVAAISRGGQMEAVPHTPLGSVTYRASKYPTLTKTDSFSVTANLRSKTCTLTDTPVALLDVHSGDLPRAGSAAGARDFNVTMSCNGTYTVHLSLTDANAPGSTSSRLVPTRNATAEGVRVELLRGGSPVALGSTWSQLSREPVALAARYYRESGAFGAGVVEGQAVITVTYR
ncbi:fimbrial protein [Stenotrophomonas maltophilia]|uniref:fimbrial protein n=1 Tax=Stenotrophomonas maltophilia TaxID=40324 RepID=UPI000AC8EFE7|nr:fimbrial protein [Stenotrophomonas maltophilia]